jgi:hypothetical protein
MGKKEKQPNPEESRYFLEVDGEPYYMTPQNSFAYLHRIDKWGDHIFVTLPPDANGQELGAFIWRRKQKNFNEMLRYLTERGMEVYQGATLSDFDRQAFIDAGMKPPEIKEPQRFELSPRQEKLAQFMAYILLTERMSAEEFSEIEGDLPI